MNAGAPPRLALSKLRHFVCGMTEVVEYSSDEQAVLAHARPLLAELIRVDDWLPDELGTPHPDHWLQNLLYCDPHERFSVLSLVWGPGQGTPPHDHTVWGLIGMLRGAELSRRFVREPDGSMSMGREERLDPGQIDAVSPSLGDIHQVWNAFKDRTSISIHVYGGNIGRITRSIYRPAKAPEAFVSGYGNKLIPNIWGYEDGK